MIQNRSSPRLKLISILPLNINQALVREATFQERLKFLENKEVCRIIGHMIFR
nr:MAG TPA: hypothetical protein [Caudoviricetes sp.]